MSRLDMPIRKRHAALAVAGATLFPVADASAVGLVTNDDDTLRPLTRMAERAHDRAVARHVRLTRVNAKLRGVADARRSRRQVRDWTLDHLSTANRKLRRKNRRLRREGATVAAGPATRTPAHLSAIAACESGGDPTAVDASGTYRGKYQFDLQTWQSIGGSGDPAAAPEAVQDRMAQRLYAQRGASPWPVCGG